MSSRARRPRSIEAPAIASAIARELNVDAVLEGSIATSDQDVRVTVRLIDAATDRYIWARTFDGEPGEGSGDAPGDCQASSPPRFRDRFTATSPAKDDNTLAVNAEAHDAY